MPMVITNQAMDTHPPLYYIFLNLICSLFEGQYSEWFGIGLNIFFMLCVYFFLYLLLQYFIKNNYLSMVLSTIFCCSYLAISMTLFIRMYVLLMALFILQSWFHLKLYEKFSSEDLLSIEKSWKPCLALAVITLAGAMTHYYFLIYQCLIAGIFVIGLWTKKRYRAIWFYVSTMVVTGITYVLLYPASINHLFLRYRGREAVHKFLKETTLFGDAIAMFKSFNFQLFKGSLLNFLAFLVITTVIMIILKKIKWSFVLKGFFLILPSIVYFYGVSKASPYVVVRYISPIAAICYAALVVWAKYLLDGYVTGIKSKHIANVMLCTLFFLTTFYFFTDSFKPTYMLERKEIVDELAKQTNYCAYITGDEYNWKMWEDYVNYPQFSGLFFIDGQAMNPITDTTLLKQDNLVIYIDVALDYNKIKDYLQTYLPFGQYELMYQNNYTYIVWANN